MLRCWSQIVKIIQAGLNGIKMPFILLKDHVTLKYHVVIMDMSNSTENIYTNGPFVTYVL